LVAAALGWIFYLAILSGGYYDLLRYAPLWLTVWILEDEKVTLNELDLEKGRQDKTRQDKTRQETV
jgi:hypothetical protein